MTIEGFFGLLAPTGTPAEIVDRLNQAMREVLASSSVLASFRNLGFTAAYSTPAQMAQRIAQGKAKYAQIIQERQIRVE